MTNYQVTWVIDIEADTPTEAAKKAQEIQRDPASIATIFSVVSNEEDGMGVAGLDALEIDLSNPGCSCGEADYGTPGHDGDPGLEDDLRVIRKHNDDGWGETS